MFKAFVLLSLLATISCLPSHNHGDEKEVIPGKPEQKPQPFPVPVDQVLRASISQTEEEEPVDATPLKTVEPTEGAPLTSTSVVETENGQSDTTDNQDKKILLLLFKFTTTTTTTTTAAAK